ncbi:MAG: ATP-binding protein [Parasutterella sp.]
MRSKVSRNFVLLAPPSCGEVSANKSANVGALIFIVTLFGSVLIIAYHPPFVQRFLKNKRVFTEMKNLGLVDGQGYGWRKIVKELESRSLPAPEIKIRKNSITVTIWFEKPLKLLSLDQRNSYVPVCQLSKGIYLFKQKFHFLIRLLKAIRRITDQDSFKGTGLK